MTRYTEAAVLFETGKPLRLVREIVLPELKPGQVLVRVMYSGICHTQLGEVRGRRGPDRFLPHMLGHEGAGEVEAIGPEVTKVKPGDKVVVTWIKGSGMDVPSTVYQSHDGDINSGAVSTFMKHAVVSENRLVSVPPSMPLREAALLGCAVPTGCGIVFNIARMKEGQSAAVFGTGGVGLCAVLGAAVAGASPIIAVDIVEAKLEMAKKLGTTHIINPLKRPPHAAIMEITDNRGVDYAIEASGNASVMEEAFRAVRNAGGLCIIAGNPTPGQRIAVDPFDLIRGKRLVGSWGGDTDPEQDIPFYIRLYQEGRINLKSLISGEYSLSDINSALNDLEEGKLIRGIVNMTAE